MSFSQITVIGNVGRNPEVRVMQDGSVVANFSVAVNDRFTDKDGNKREQTHWFQVDVWQAGDRGGLVDIVSKYVVAGSQVMVQGRPIIKKWTDKDGVQRDGFSIRLSGPSAQLRLLGGVRPAQPPAEGATEGEPPASGGERKASAEGGAPGDTTPKANGVAGTSRSRRQAPVVHDDEVPF